ncbi:MAG: TolC family protein [Bryobacteraceae bacterium]
MPRAQTPCRGYLQREHSELFSGDQTGRFSLITPNDTGGIGVNGSGNGGSGALDIFALRLAFGFSGRRIFGLNTNDIPALLAGRAQKEVLEWTRHLKREDVIFRITDAFVTTVAAQNRAGFTNRRVSLLEETLNNVEQQQKQGLKLPIDVNVTRDQLGGARSLVRVIQEQAVAGKLEIAQLLGFSSGAGFTLAGTLPEPPRPPDADQLISKATGQHPSVRVQQATAERAKQNWRLERFRNYPTVTLNGNAIFADDFNPPESPILPQ